MRKYAICLLAIVLVFANFATPCQAIVHTDSDIVYLDDGSYYVIQLTSEQIGRTSSSIGGNKTYRYYNADDVLQWTFVLNGTFSYNPGISASCTSATCNVQISNTSWSCKTKSASPSGNRALGNAEVIYKFLFVTTKTVPVSLTITCNSYGELT